MARARKTFVQSDLRSSRDLTLWKFCFNESLQYVRANNFRHISKNLSEYLYTQRIKRVIKLKNI